MASISIDFPDNKIQDAIALVARKLYQDEIDDGEGNMIPNPQNHAQFAKSEASRQIIKWLRHLQQLEKSEELGTVGQNDFEIT